MEQTSPSHGGINKQKQYAGLIYSIFLTQSVQYRISVR